MMAIIEVAAANPAAYGGREATVVSGMTPHGGGGRRAPGKLSIEEVSKALHVLFPRARTRGPSSTEIIRKMRDERYGKLDASGKAIK